MKTLILLSCLFLFSCKKDDELSGRTVTFYNLRSDSVQICCNGSGFYMRPFDTVERIETCHNPLMIGQTYIADKIKNGNLTFIQKGIVTYSNRIY